MDDFAALILTHGRPNNVVTYDTLRKHGYTGRIVVVIDNEDDRAEEYRDMYGDEVVVFDKKAIAQTFDQADNFNDRRAIVYARNASFEIAKELGLKYFIQLDDDYVSFRYSEDNEGNYVCDRYIDSLDKAFEDLLTFLKETGVHSIALAQGGDFIGGETSRVFQHKIVRKCMNSFICSVDNPFQFVGRINEDVNTYTYKASLGNIFFTISKYRLEQKQTQSNKGGMTDIYLDNGTYVKSFYSVIFAPSAVDIRMMGHTDNRLHHHVKWKNAIPMIVSEDHKKQ